MLHTIVHHILAPLRYSMGLVGLAPLVPPCTRGMTPENTALLLIDVQKKYADPSQSRGNAETDRIAKKIAGIAPAFRRAAVKVFPIYFGEHDLQPAKIDFHRFKPKAKDVIVRKDRDSAFLGSNISDLLHAGGYRNLIVAGFNLSACIKETAIHGCEEGFNVVVLRDLTANDNHNPECALWEVFGMKRRGALFRQTDDILKKLSTRSPATP